MEALNEVLLELEPTEPMMKKYKMYLQKQSTDNSDITDNQNVTWPAPKNLFRTFHLV